MVLHPAVAVALEQNPADAVKAVRWILTHCRGQAELRQRLWRVVLLWSHNIAALICLRARTAQLGRQGAACLEGCLYLGCKRVQALQAPG